MRVVIDTNVLISAVFWSGKPKQVLNLVRWGKIVFLTSEILLNELREVLESRKKPFKLSSRESSRVVGAIRELAEIVDTRTNIDTCRHRMDNRVLECAVDGRADYIISGDRHLLELKEYRDTRITTVAGFLKAAAGARG